MQSDATTRILTLIAEVLELDPSEIKPESHLFNDLGASSLDIAEMVWRIEDDKDFNIGEIPDDVLDEIRLVRDITNFVVRQVTPSGASDGSNSGAKLQTSTASLVIASDHAGVALKAALREHLSGQGFAVEDFGPTKATPVDYPSVAAKLGQHVAGSPDRLGILICGTGVGMSIAANKVHGVRAALIHEPVSAKLAREHNNANVLCLGARILGEELARACTDAFLSASFSPGDDGRHQRRVKGIHEIEKLRQRGDA